MIYIFDIDGTLTPPREPMNGEFAEQFATFCRHNVVYLATGSDQTKMELQVPATVRQACTGIFTCAGSVFEAGGKRIYNHDHEFPDELVDWLDEQIASSAYLDRYGRHIEYRTGQINTSVVGRSATKAQRKAYNLWDSINHERARLCKQVAIRFPDYEASAGGEISIDISPAGWNKARVIAPILERHGNSAITFIGDKITSGGNDWHLAEALRTNSSQHVVIEVGNWLYTKSQIEAIEPVNQLVSA